MAAFLALLSALGQNGLRVLADLLVDRPGIYGAQIWWATAAGELALALGASVLAIGVSSFALSSGRRVYGTALVLFPAVMTALLFVPRVAPWALALLAVGVCLRVADSVEGRWGLIDRTVRRLLPIAAMVTIAAALGAMLVDRIGEWRAERRLPPAATEQPNVLLLIWDTVRAGSLSLYGHTKATTPGLMTLAREGVVFDRAYATAPWTLPSHASMFTGRDAHELSTDWRRGLSSDPPVIAEVLSAAGYRTAAFSANQLYVNRAFGLARGFAHFDDASPGLKAITRASTLIRRVITSPLVRQITGYADEPGRIRAADQQRRLLRWLAGRKNRPYFAFVNFMDAHQPYPAPAPFDTAAGFLNADMPPRERRRIRLLTTEAPALLPPADAARMQSAYEASVAALDAETTSLLQALQRTGNLTNTLVVLAADHGEEFGEHGVWVHGNSLYPQSLHVPLVLRFPGHVPEGVRVASAVSLRDLPATILDLLGMAPALPGESLRGLWSGHDQPVSAHVRAEVRYAPGLDPDAPVSRGTMASVINDSLELIREGDGRERLLDLNSVPFTGKEILGRPDLRALLRAGLSPKQP